MAAKTTVKVATLTGAAKDDSLTSGATGLTEDNLSATLNVMANDPGSARLYSLAQDTSSLSASAQFPVTDHVTLASGAIISMNSDGTVGYDGSALNLNSLAQGESFTDTFTYTVRMANGALSTARVSVEIAGENDAPTIASVAPVSIDDSGADDASPAVFGQLIGADADHGAALHYSMTETGANHEYGSIDFDAATGAYSFTADADKIDALHAGESVTVSFAAQATDEHDASSATQTVEFTLVGANDIAEMSGGTTVSVTEDSTTMTASGTLTVTDRDSDESAFQAPSATALHGAYGDFTFDAGNWTYALRNGDANVQALNDGQTVSDALTIFSLDGSASQTISVDIHGANEPVVVTPPVGEPEVNPVTTFMVNNGLSIVNHQSFFNDFDSNDQITYSGNFTFNGVVQDTVSDGANFTFTHGRVTETVTVVLVGYNTLTTDQVVHA